MAFDLIFDVHLKFHQLKQRERKERSQHTYTMPVEKAQPILCSRCVSCMECIIFLMHSRTVKKIEETN